MKNTFGTSVALTLFGESHGDQIGCVLDGLAPGIAIKEEEIAAALSLRRPMDDLSTARREPDPFRIVSGVFEGRTTGTPLCILIPNLAQRSSDYQKEAPLRPGHADFSAFAKYHGFQDVRGGGHFSGRITAPLVAAGAILRRALREKGIRIGTHVLTIHGVKDRPFENVKNDLDFLDTASFPVFDPEAGEAMKREILSAKAEGDSVGGSLETLVTGLPAGVGEPWFDSVESVLSHALFSIPAVKGVAFGAGEAFAAMRGSQSNDSYFLDENGRVRTRSNHNGGILGGITNGEDLVFSTVIKPTPTISCRQESVILSEKKECTVSFGGRHDPCIVPRARIVQDSVVALVLCDLLAQRFGTDFFGEEK